MRPGGIGDFVISTRILSGCLERLQFWWLSICIADSEEASTSSSLIAPLANHIVTGASTVVSLATMRR